MSLSQVLSSRPTDLSRLASWAAQRHGSAVAQRFKRQGEWQERTFTELAAQVEGIAAGLRRDGIEPGDRVAILAETSPEWTACDLAIAQLGAIGVPIYPTSSAEEIEWVIGDSGARLLILETDEHYRRLESVRGSLPDLQTVVGIATAASSAVLLLTDLAAPEPAADAEPEIDPDSPLTIMYTSGTTGNPKGCMLSHANFRAILDSVEELSSLAEGDVIYVYLPLAHLFTRMVQFVALETGATLAYTGGDIRQVADELKEVAPTHLPSVPRLFEKVYATVTAQLAALPAEQRAELEATLLLGTRVRRARELGEPITEHDQAAFDAAESGVFSIVRDVFGGRVREALTGAAPIAPHILEFFYACGVPIYEAYGMTEATAVISCNRPGATRFGSVGRPVSRVEVRIAADGEICARSAGTFLGYWRNEAATAEMVVDGWLHTGDLGEVDDGGYLRVTGRKKDIIITSGGKNLTPANIENDLRGCRWISQAVMCGDRRPYPVALITLDAEEVLGWARARGIDEDIASLATNPELVADIRAAVAAANERYAPPERIRAFEILPADFTVDSGELTATMKVRRAVVNERHAATLDALYLRGPD